MGRRSRRLGVRMMRTVALAAGGVFFYQRWQLRPSNVYPVSSFRPTPSPRSGAPDDRESGEERERRRPCLSRSERWHAFTRGSTPEDPFDLLVIGGGLTGLYTAVDAAQRGLRVALLDAADIGGGSTTAQMPSVTPGLFPFVQRATRQRDVEWLWVGLRQAREETIWCHVASDCVVAPDTVKARCRKAWDRTVGQLFMKASFAASPRDEDAVLDQTPATTLIPALHSSEILEYACAAMLSTLLSALCGPLRPNAILSAAAVERRLPSLASSPSSGVETAVRVKGGVVTNDVVLRGNTAAVALARTAEALGVHVLTYAPVVAIEERRETTAAAPARNKVNAGQDGSKNLNSVTSTAQTCSSLMVAHVFDTLKNEPDVPSSSVTPQDSTAAPPSSRGGSSRWLPWWGRHDNTENASSLALHAAIARDLDELKNDLVKAPGAKSPNTTANATAYARVIVNGTGCWADTVKSLYSGNGQDTVPFAFAGYQAYTYLVAPQEALHATVPSSGASPLSGAGPTLSASTHTSGLHFSSPRLSFAAVMVLPWWDRCVLLGPTISPLAGRFTRDAATTSHDLLRCDDALLPRTSKDNQCIEAAVAVSSSDGYRAQQERILAMLRRCGVAVETPQLLSCVTQIVPYVKSLKEVPFQQALLKDGYALHLSSVPLSEDGDEGVDAARVTAEDIDRNRGSAITREEKESAAPRRDVAFLHVYGGTPVLARRIARDVVDAVVRHPSFLPAETVKKLYRCRTHQLRLDTPEVLQRDASTSSAASSSSASPADAVARLRKLIVDTYAERLTDVIARRSHVMYTSPQDALQALPSIASVMAELKGWSKARVKAEMEAVEKLVAAVAVSVNSASTVREERA